MMFGLCIWHTGSLYRWSLKDIGQRLRVYSHRRKNIGKVVGTTSIEGFLVCLSVDKSYWMLWGSYRFCIYRYELHYTTCQLEKCAVISSCRFRWTLTHPKTNLDFLASGSVRIEALPWTISVPTAVLIAESISIIDDADKRSHWFQLMPYRQLPPAWVNRLIWYCSEWTQAMFT